MRFDRSDPSPACIAACGWPVSQYRRGIAVFAGADQPTLPRRIRRFSTLGLLAIMLWGCAYASVARVYQRVPGLVAGVCAGKLYTGNWLIWLDANAHRLPALFAEAPLTAVFYGILAPVIWRLRVVFLR